MIGTATILTGVRAGIKRRPAAIRGRTWRPVRPREAHETSVLTGRHLRAASRKLQCYRQINSAAQDRQVHVFRKSDQITRAIVMDGDGCVRRRCEKRFSVCGDDRCSLWWLTCLFVPFPTLASFNLSTRTLARTHLRVRHAFGELEP